MRTTHFCTTDEAAKRLGCDPKHVSWLIQRGHLTGRLWLRFWMVNRSSLEKWKKYGARRKRAKAPESRLTAENRLTASESRQNRLTSSESSLTAENRLTAPESHQNRLTASESGLTAGSFIAVAKAAERLGVHKHHVTLLLRRGGLRGTKWGNGWMVSDASVARYMRLDRRPKMGRPRADS